MITSTGYNNCSCSCSCKIPVIIIISLVLFIFQINNDLDLNSKYFEYIYAIENIDETNKDEEIDFDYIFDPGEYFEEDNTFLNKNNNLNNNTKNNETNQLTETDNSNYTIKEISDSKIDNQQFKTVSNISITSDFNFASVGDWNCKSETKDTVENMIEQSPELVLALGDLSYDSSASCWFKIIQPVADITKIAMGNHESESSKKLKDYKEFFGLEKQYYSFNYENVHFLALSTEIPYEEDSEQYEFAIRDLEQSFKDSSIDWNVVFYHKQAYSSGGGPDDEDDFREVYHPLFDKFNVDLALQGHVHAYERLYPITFNEDDDDEPIIQDNNTNTYINSKGTIFVTVGTGGASEHELSKKKYFSAAGVDGTFGILNIEVHNNNNNNNYTANDSNNITKTLTGRFIENEDDDEFKILDEFTIIKNS
ncbi:MAG: metallophosphoesterase [Nitrososphaeraceae archaeon]